ncbi:hypothetical protein WDZ17_12480 [Pseudokineococcus basanitobsidens]|uniref:DNA ligase D polymerase domain-containing protein n=1 Tax=Pseudokineococcus basanitobsidens TaxID=1926649 RepID=A0ABU8RM44_9ACTN
MAAARRDEPDEVRHGVPLTSLGSELFDGAGATKRDLVDHVEALADRLLPELAGRPLTVVRVRPGQRPFVQKNLPASAPAWIPVREVWSEASHRTVRYPLVEDVATLVWLAGQRAVELHPTVLDGEGRATRLVVDLDPPEGAPFEHVVHAARLVRRVLDDAGLGAAVTTSGAKGLHVVVPVRGVAVEDAAAVTRALAARAERLDPDAVTTAYLLADRGGRVYLDPTRAGGGTLAAVYAPRVRPGTPVSFPVAWDALDDVVPGQPTVRTAATVLGDADPWRASLPAPQDVPAALVDEGRTIPPPRAAAMHAGRRRARAARPPG